MRLYLLCLFIFSCGGNSELSRINFTQYVDSKNLRIFGKEDVDSDFLDKVASSYDAMFGDNFKIDEDMRSHYLSTSLDKRVFQRVGLESSFSENESYADNGKIPGPYRHNCTDYIWQESSGGPRQINEVIEHLLHTVTNVILNLAYPADWGFMNSSTRLREAMQEAIDKGVYNVSQYDEFKGDTEGYNSVITQEYAYWLILAEWNYFDISGNRDNENITGNSEFSLGTSDEIRDQLPIGHKLYVDYIEKILTEPDKQLIESLFK